MNVTEWARYLIAELDPAINAAIGSLTAAISMAIITIVSYYFPKDHSKFDEKLPPYSNQYVEPKRRKKKKKQPVLLEDDGGSNE